MREGGGHRGEVCIFLFKQTSKQRLRGPLNLLVKASHLRQHMSSSVSSSEPLFSVNTAASGDRDWNRKPAMVMKCDNLLEKRHVWYVFQLDVSKIYGSFRQDFQRNPFSYSFQASESVNTLITATERHQRKFLPHRFHKLHFSLQKMCLSLTNSGISHRLLSLIFPSTVGKLLASQDSVFSSVQWRDSAK